MSSLEYALNKARELPYKRGEQRHYALVLDKKDRVISEAANSYIRTHTAMYKASRKLGLVKDYCHSELLALIKDRDRRGVKLVVVRVNSKGEACYSEPCLVCKEILKNFNNIKSVEFSL